eukprot:g20665.t1
MQQSEGKEEASDRLGPAMTKDDLEQYYATRMEELGITSVTVKFVPGFGKGLFALRDIAQGEWVFTEDPTLFFIDDDRRVRACSFCMKCLGTLEEQFIQFDQYKKSEEAEDDKGDVYSGLFDSSDDEGGSATEAQAQTEAVEANEEQSQATADKLSCYLCVPRYLEGRREAFEPAGLSLPFKEQATPVDMTAQTGWLPCQQGCGELYCSDECRSKAWQGWHKLICPKANPVLWELGADMKHDHPTNLHLGLKGVCAIVLRAERLQKEQGLSIEESIRSAALPFRALCSGLWWEVGDYQVEENTRRDWALSFHRLMLRAFPELSAPDSPYAPLFAIDFWARLCGALELNSMSLFSASLLAYYLDWIETQDKTSLSRAVIRQAGRSVWRRLEESEEVYAEGSGVAEIFVNMNHSCEPNMECTKEDDAQTHRLAFRAVRNIKRGEQLCINYMLSQQHNLDRQTRQIYLRIYGFECNCPRCLREQDLEQNDKRVSLEQRSASDKDDQLTDTYMDTAGESWQEAVGKPGSTLPWLEDSYVHLLPPPIYCIAIDPYLELNQGIKADMPPSIIELVVLAPLKGSGGTLLICFRTPVSVILILETSLRENAAEARYLSIE